MSKGKNVQRHLDMLNHKGEDRVTGATGVITGICFDSFGCIQASMNHGLDKDGKHQACRWYDVGRIKITSKKTVMPQPDFDLGYVAEGKKGAADKTPQQ